MENTFIKTAEELSKLRQEEAKIKEKFEEMLKPLKEEKEKKQAELIQELHEIGLSSVKVESGESYAIKKGKSLIVTSEAMALKWAIDNRAVSINKTIVKQKLKDTDEVPKGFNYEEREFISISKPRVKERKV